jgi:hypothetical protein
MHMTTTPAYLPILVLGMSMLMMAATLYGLSQALQRAAWSEALRAGVVRAAAVLLIGWFALALALALVGAFEGVPGRPPTIQYGFLVPVAIAAVLIWRSDMVAGIIDAVPQHWLIGVQGTRVLGAIFLVLYAAGQMPALFAVPASLGDLAVAGLAPLVAYAAARDPHASDPSTRARITGWNLLGIADFIVAFAAGLATGNSPLQVAAFDNPNALIDIYPLVLIPVFLVPLWTILHIVSLTKLRRAVAASHRTPAAGRSA